MYGANVVVFEGILAFHHMEVLKVRFHFKSVVIYDLCWAIFIEKNITRVRYYFCPLIYLVAYLEFPMKDSQIYYTNSEF